MEAKENKPMAKNSNDSNDIKKQRKDIERQMRVQERVLTLAESALDALEEKDTCTIFELQETAKFLRTQQQTIVDLQKQLANLEVQAADHALTPEEKKELESMSGKAKLELVSNFEGLFDE